MKVSFYFNLLRVCYQYLLSCWEIVFLNFKFSFLYSRLSYVNNFILVLQLDESFKKLADVETPTCNTTDFEEVASSSQGIIITLILILVYLGGFASQPMNSTRVGYSQGAPPLLGVSRIELSSPTESLQEVNADVVPSTSCSTLADPLPDSSHPLQLSSQLISHRCDMCGKICQRKEGLTLHRKTCKGQGVETNNLSVHLTCVLCDTQVGNSSPLRKHTRK